MYLLFGLKAWDLLISYYRWLLSGLLYYYVVVKERSQVVCVCVCVNVGWTWLRFSRVLEVSPRREVTTSHFGLQLRAVSLPRSLRSLWLVCLPVMVFALGSLLKGD